MHPIEGTAIPAQTWPRQARAGRESGLQALGRTAVSGVHRDVVHRLDDVVVCSGVGCESDARPEFGTAPGVEDLVGSYWETDLREAVLQCVEDGSGTGMADHCEAPGQHVTLCHKTLGDDMARQLTQLHGIDV